MPEGPENEHFHWELRNNGMVERLGSENHDFSRTSFMDKCLQNAIVVHNHITLATLSAQSIMPRTVEVVLRKPTVDETKRICSYWSYRSGDILCSTDFTQFQVTRILGDSITQLK